MKQITQGTMYRLLLRANIEAFYNNCRFIFTCNYKNKIIEPLHSRCAVVDFATTSKDRPRIAASFFKRLQQILDAEGVEFDNKVLVELVNKHFLTSGGFLMSVKGSLLVEALIVPFLPLLVMYL